MSYIRFFILCTGLLISACLHAEDYQFINQTGYELVSVSMRGSDDTWGNNLLDDRSFKNGDAIKVVNNRPDDNVRLSSRIDVKAIDVQGNTYLVEDLDKTWDRLAGYTIATEHLISEGSSSNSGKKQAVEGFSGYIDITNNTGYEIYYLYVSHEDSDSWEQDMLGEDTLSNGQTFRVSVTDYSSSIFDVRAEDEDGDTYTLYGINIATEDIDLTLNDLDDSSSSGNSNGYFNGYVDIENGTGLDLHYIYVSHEASDNWEEDVLGDDILGNSDIFRVTLSNYDSSIFDIKAQDENGNTYTVYGLDVEIDDLRLTKKNRD